MEFKDRYQFNEEEHIHTLDGKPLTGTSSVMSIVGKPGLVWWSSGLAVAELGWTNPKFTGKSEREIVAAQRYGEISDDVFDKDGHFQPQVYLTFLDKAYAAHSKSLAKSANKGKDMHAELEKYVKECIANWPTQTPPIAGEHFSDCPQVIAFSKWANENVEYFLFSEMHTYSEENWLGGITDCGALMKDGKIAIIDFKSSKDAYASQFWQCGGYHIQIAENGGFNKEGDRVFDPVNADLHIVIPFGAPEFKVVIDKDVIANVNSFKAALHLYRENQRLTNE